MNNILFLKIPAQSIVSFLFRSTPSAWGLVLDQCLWLLDHPEVKQYAVISLRPVLLYLFCDPNYHAHFGAMRATLFDRLLAGCRSFEGGESSSLEGGDSSCFSCLQHLMTWLQLDNRNNSLPEMAGYVIKFFTFLLESEAADRQIR